MRPARFTVLSARAGRITGSAGVDDGPMTIIQIGSNDGRAGDPIFDPVKRREQWSALLVEPVPHLYYGSTGTTGRARASLS